MLTLVAILIGLIGVGTGPGSLTEAEIDARIEKWQPTERELAWRRISWARDIRDALKLAKSSRRPVFLFTHDGRLGIGRC